MPRTLVKISDQASSMVGVESYPVSVAAMSRSAAAFYAATVNPDGRRTQREFLLTAAVG
jgi:hypothetical protein